MSCCFNSIDYKLSVPDGLDSIRDEYRVYSSKSLRFSIVKDNDEESINLNWGSLSTIIGKFRTNSGWFDRIIPFRVSLSDATDLQITPVLDNSKDYFPSQLNRSHSTKILASEFPISSPVESMTILVSSGNYTDLKRNKADTSKTTNVLVLNYSFKFKSSHQLAVCSHKLENCNFDVILDKIVLFDGDIRLPVRSDNIPVKEIGPNLLPFVFTFFSSGIEWNIYVTILFFSWMSWVFGISLLVFAILLSLLLLLAISPRGRLSNAIRNYFASDGHKNMSFFVNGWQAWSFCGAVLHGHLSPMYSMFNVFAKGFHDGGEGTSFSFNAGDENSNINNSASWFFGWRGIDVVKDFFMASDMFTALTNLDSNCGIVIGFLSQKMQFGCIATNRDFSRITVHASGDGVHIIPGSIVSTDWLTMYAFDSLIEPFRTYMAMSRDENDALVRSRCNSTLLNTCEVPVGWCSWYHFFEKVSEEDLMKNLQCMKRMKEKYNLAADRMGFNLFQIDDGYQNAWGDWSVLNKKTFPKQSLYNIVTHVKDEHMVGGIWMAPFACDKHSMIAKQHPDWILRRKGSSTVACNSGNCGKWFFGLDVTNEDVQEHVKENILVATGIWGFTYLKLDFLYASVLGGVQESFKVKSLTKAQILQKGMKLIKDTAGPGVFILGCGAPLGSVIGHVHANRISSDAGLSWLPEFPLPTSDKWNLPCARNMVRNSLCRMFMHGYWWINDPDCMLLRPSLHFSEEELLGIATVKAFSGGSFILSDDLDTLTSSRLRVALQLLPPTNVAAVPLDLLSREMPELLRLQLESPPLPPHLNLVCNSANKIVNLMKNWTLVAVCNWDNKYATEKTHTMSIVDIFDQPIVDAAIASQRSHSQSTLCLLFKFNFWTETYHHIQVNLTGEDEQLVQFTAIPHHSARIYKVGLYTQPNCPVWVGSNLHFSCGCELAALLEVDNPAGLDESVLAAFHNSTLRTGHSIIELATDNKNHRGFSLTNRTVRVVFADGALRDPSWGGYVWLFLPTLLHPIQSILPCLHISGTAWHGHDYTAIESGVSIVAEVCQCGVNGYVFKIPVGTRRILHPIEVLKDGSSDEGVSQYQQGLDELLISWIYNKSG